MLYQICAAVTSSVSQSSTGVVVIRINGTRRLHSRVLLVTHLLFGAIYYRKHSSVVWMICTHIVIECMSLGCETVWWVPSLPSQRLCELFPTQALQSHLFNARCNSLLWALQIPISVHGMSVKILVVSFPITVFYLTLLDQLKAGLDIMES